MLKRRFRSLAVAAVAVATVGAGLLAGGGTAFAASSNNPVPPWNASINAGTLLGGITFYNAQGQVVTGGSITAPGVAAYAVGTGTAVPAGYSKGQLGMYTPVSGQNPGTWSSSFIGTSTTFPATTAPAPIGGLTATNPVNTGASTDATIASLISAFPNVQTAAGYPNLYDIRMIVSGAGVPALAGYYDVVISVNITGGTATNPTAGTWTVDYANYTQNTTTTLTASPASPQTAPASPATLTATVAPATAGTVSFWNGTTQVGTTQTVTATSGVATVTTTPAAGTTSYQAIFTPAVANPPVGTGNTLASYDIGSSATLSYVVNTPKDATSTTLAQSGGGTAAGPVTFTGTVTDTTTPATTITAGTVSLYDNGSTTAFASGAVGAGGAYSITFTYSSAGAHSVVATFVPASGATVAGSSSAAVTFTETAPACTTCNDVQTITGTIPAGTIAISTPYTPANPLNLGTLALTPSGSYFTASAKLESNASAVPTAGQSPNTTFNGITVVDTKSGSTPWTVSAAASNLSDGSGHPNGAISGENVGLTGLTPVFVPGNAIVAGNVTVTNQSAATPPVGPTDPGSAGLGGVPHVIATDSAQPTGTVGINGTVTLNAPTSTEAGIFTGTITFTIAG
jgi:hypothetical protein